MAVPSRLEVTDLSRADCEALLKRNHLGRLAFSFRDRVDLQPLMYACDDGWIFGRTSPGSKLVTLQHNRWVAFQVDEIQDIWHWKSVVVRGAVHLLEEAVGTEASELWARARAALRSVVPETLDVEDPAPERSILFGLALQETSGRSATLVPLDPSQGSSTGR